MLSITAKVRTLAEELDSAIKMCKDLQETLAKVQPDQLTDKVGIYARQMPEWKILTQEYRQGIDFVRQVCTGEIPIFEAQKLTQKLLDELQRTRRLIKI